MERRGQELAVSISPDSVSSGQLAQPDRQPNPLRFRTFNQGGNVLGEGAAGSGIWQAGVADLFSRVSRFWNSVSPIPTPDVSELQRAESGKAPCWIFYTGFLYTLPEIASPWVRLSPAKQCVTSFKSTALSGLGQMRDNGGKLLN